MVTILGRGAWGSALASVLEANNQEYVVWDRKSEIDPTSIVVLAIPTQAIREVLTNNKKNLEKSIIINTSKGIEKDTHKLPFEIATEVLGTKIKYFSLFGPSFAVEVEEKLPTLLNLASLNNNRKLAQEIKEIFETDYFRIRIAGSSQALELSGALKNIYAILCGISEGLGFFFNTRSQLIGHAYKETLNLCRGFNYKVDSQALECIMGDLVLTCSSLESRNFRFGKYLVKLKVKDALKQVASTVEGRNNILSVPYLIEKTGVDLPFAKFVYETVVSDSPKTVEKRFREVITKV
jgi:glycerol-3-phosphate dehydrogenase (NAD(P)+)